MKNQPSRGKRNKQINKHSITFPEFVSYADNVLHRYNPTDLDVNELLHWKQYLKLPIKKRVDYVSIFEQDGITPSGLYINYSHLLNVSNQRRNKKHQQKIEDVKSKVIKKQFKKQMKEQKIISTNKKRSLNFFQKS